MRWPWSKKTLDLPPVAEIVDSVHGLPDGQVERLAEGDG